MKFNEKGRSMIEMLGVLAIIGVLSAAGLAGYSRAMAKHKMNQTINQMATIVSNIRTAFVNAQNNEKPYADLYGKSKEDATVEIAKLNAFPPEMVINQDAPEIRNVYKGLVWVEAVDDGASFNVEFEDLPDEVAVALGVVDWGLSDASGLQEVLIAPAEEENGGGSI